MTDYVRQTCIVLATNSTNVVLGATVGDDADIEESAAGICAPVSEQRAMIATVGHAATELVLTRSCADVAKLSSWLRCYGDVLGGGTADRFDRELCAALSGTLGGDISDTAWWQAGLGVDHGGLRTSSCCRGRAPRVHRESIGVPPGGFFKTPYQPSSACSTRRCCPMVGH